MTLSQLPVSSTASPTITRYLAQRGGFSIYNRLQGGGFCFGHAAASTQRSLPLRLRELYPSNVRFSSYSTRIERPAGQLLFLPGIRKRNISSQQPPASCLLWCDSFGAYHRIIQSSHIRLSVWCTQHNNNKRNDNEHPPL